MFRSSFCTRCFASQRVSTSRNSLSDAAPWVDYRQSGSFVEPARNVRIADNTENSQKRVNWPMLGSFGR
jgi:hypothetical protein